MNRTKGSRRNESREEKWNQQFCHVEKCLERHFTKLLESGGRVRYRLKQKSELNTRQLLPSKIQKTEKLQEKENALVSYLAHEQATLTGSNSEN